MNKHIIEYCLDYIKSELNPKFAILIKGEWGCGKSFLIGKLIEKIIGEKLIEEKEIIKLSVYGVCSKTDLDQKMYHAIHPILSSDAMKITGLVLNTAVKLGTTIDISDTKKGIFKNKKITITKKKLLIIDDIERCQMDSTELLGYFSELVIDGDMKTIFIGNIEKITNNNFKEIKEKLIGIEFIIKANLEKAIVSFIDELELENIDSIITDTCLFVMNTLKYANLRNARQGLFNFKILLNIFPEEIEKDLLAKIFEIFIILFLQRAEGSIEEENVKETILAFVDYKISYKEYAKKNKSDDSQKYIFYTPEIPLLNCWKDLIFNGDYREKKVLDNYNKDIAPSLEASNNILIILLRNWRDLTPDKFKESINTLTKSFNDGNYLKPAEILHYTNLMSIFSNIGIIPDTLESIKESIIEIITKYKKSITIIDDFNDYSMSYGGYGLSGKNREVQEIKNILIKNNKDNLFNKKAKDFKYEIENFESSFKVFIQKISYNTDSENYYECPIISLIEPEYLYEKITTLSNSDQMTLAAAFENRYGKNHNQRTLKIYMEDLPHLKVIVELYKANIGDIQYNPEAFQRKNLVERYKDLVEYMKKSNVQ